MGERLWNKDERLYIDISWYLWNYNCKGNHTNEQDAYAKYRDNYV